MDTKIISRGLKALCRSSAKHYPGIWLVTGILSGVYALYLAIEETPKAMEVIDKKKEEEGELGITEIVKSTWKIYVPSIAAETCSIFLILGSHGVLSKRYRALAAAYSFTSAAYGEYKNKVVSVIGEEKNREIMDKIADDHIQKNPLREAEIITTGWGKSLCYDIVSGRYFMSDTEQLKEAVNEINRRMLTEMFISLNDFYSEIGLPEISIGDDLGWNIDKGFIELSFSTKMSEDMRPCIVVNYYVLPEYRTF